MVTFIKLSNANLRIPFYKGLVTIVTVLLKSNVSNARNFIVTNQWVLSLSRAYQACILCLHFRLLEIKTGITKESSATGYRQINPQTDFFLNQV